MSTPTPREEPSVRQELREAFAWMERELAACTLEYGRFKLEAQVHGKQLIKVHKSVEISIPPNPAEKNGRNSNEWKSH